jgi:CRP/FNR family transcriptional regulator
MAVAAELGPAQRLHLSGLTAERRNVPRGSALFRNGDPLEALYEVHEGVFKTCLIDATGRSQVTGFQMSGEMLGLDGIGAERHCVDAVALEDVRVCVIPFAGLNELLQDSSALQRLFHKALSREIVREHAMMLLLGTLTAAGRIAAFVLDLSQRVFERGGSPSVLVLCMTREEIGSYLGLQIETVSRAFSRLQNEGVLDIRNRHVLVLDPVALRRIAHGG